MAQTLGAFPRGLRGQGRHEEDRADGSLGARIDEMRGSNCLRPEQRKVADRTLEGRPTLLRGVAGSGKSILLAQGLVYLLHRAGRASRCADDPDGPRVLVTCFNKTLVPLLRRDADAFAVETGLQLPRFKLDFVHFEGVLKKLREEWGLTVPGLRQGDDEANDARYPMVFRQVEELFASGAATEEEALWDFVFVDEAQDLHPDALRLLHRMARVDPKTRARGIAIYYDDARTYTVDLGRSGGISEFTSREGGRCSSTEVAAPLVRSQPLPSTFCSGVRQSR